MPTPPIAPGTRVRVLLVEGSPRLQGLLADSVRQIPGLELVGVADQAPGALEHFARLRPDLVILDLILQSGTGLAVLRSIKLTAPRCQVLVFSLLDGAADRARCTAAGADRFFSKAREHRDLLRHLHRLSGFVSGPLAAVHPIDHRA